MDSTTQSDVAERAEHGQILLYVSSTSQRSIIEQWLDVEGFRTVECNTLTHLMSHLARYEPDMVIIGSSPNEMAAAKFSAWIRAKSGVPVIAIVETRSIDIVELLEAGADIVIVEPLSRFEFVARVRAVLRRTPARTSADQVIVFDQLKLDLTNQHLSLPGGSVHLTGRELAMMETLMRSGARVCSRRQLQSVLALPSKELDYLIRRVRQRIEAIEGRRRIVSRHGLGFQLLTSDQLCKEESPSDVSRASAIESIDQSISPSVR